MPPWAGEGGGARVSSTAHTSVTWEGTLWRGRCNKYRTSKKLSDQWIQWLETMVLVFCFFFLDIETNGDFLFRTTSWWLLFFFLQGFGVWAGAGIKVLFLFLFNFQGVKKNFRTVFLFAHISVLMINWQHSNSVFLYMLWLREFLPFLFVWWASCSQTLNTPVTVGLSGVSRYVSLCCFSSC